MRFGSLFTGIGGLDLGLERAGFEVRWQVENDPFAIRVLTKHWPDIDRHTDVREVSGSSLEAVDLICGGFPCQPVSHAGGRQAQADERWLWPEFARLVGDLRPRYVLVENVPGLWTTANAGSEVISDLAALGYDSQWDRLFAATVGAPHLRERVFILAYPSGARRQQESRGAHEDEVQHAWGSETQDHQSPGDGQGHGAGQVPRHVADTDSHGRSKPGLHGEREQQVPSLQSPRSGGVSSDPRGDGGGETEAVANPDITGPQGHGSQRGLAEGGRQGQVARSGDDRGTEEVADPDLSRRDGGSRDSRTRGRQEPENRGGVHPWGQDPAEGPEPRMGRVAHGVPDRMDRLRTLGNAVVPQVGELIGQWILEVDRG